jgi:hypothetical protein
MCGEGDEISDFCRKRNSVVESVIIYGEKIRSQSKSANKTKRSNVIFKHHVAFIYTSYIKYSL